LQPVVRYFIRRDRDGSVSTLARITRTETQLHGEYLRGGKWSEDGSIMEFLQDPLYGDEISEAEAATIAPRFGGSIP
jgi:hypothetical protein